MFWTDLEKYRDAGLLLLRAFFGLYMAIGHGYGKITGGPEQWAQLGGVMDGLLGIGFLPTLWGFLAAAAEFIGALMVTIGLLTRPAALFVTLNMLVAASAHMSGVIDGGPEMALLYAVLFFSIILVGPGRYSIDDMNR